MLGPPPPGLTWVVLQRQLRRDAEGPQLVQTSKRAGAARPTLACERCIMGDA